MVGLLALSYSAAQFITTPALGILSDRYGRRPVYSSCVGTGLGYSYLGLPIPSGCSLQPDQSIASLGNFSVAQAYIADVLPRSTKILLGAALGLG